MVGLIAFWLTFSLPSLLTYPTPHGDEALFGSTAYNLLKNGSFGIPVYGDVNGSSEDFIYIGRFQVVALAAWFRFFGVSLISGRLFAVSGTILTAIFVWLTARRRIDARYAVVAGALCLFAWKSFYAGHRVRPDIWVAFAGALILWLYTHHREHSGLLGFVAGALLNIHIPVAFFIVAVSLVMLSDLLTKRIATATFVRFCFGLTTGLLFWLALLLLPDPQRTITQYQGGLLGAPGGSLNLQNYSVAVRLQQLWSLAQETFLNSTRLGWLEVLTILAASIGLPFLKPSADDRNLLVFTFGMVGCIALTPYLQPYYMVMTVPIFALVMACAAYRLTKVSGTRIGLVVVTPLLLAYVAGDLAFAFGGRVISYQRYGQALKALVPTGSSVFSDGRFWFELYDQPFTSDYYLLFAPQAQTMPPEAWVRHVLASRHIEIIIRSDVIAPWFPAKDDTLARIFDKVLHENCTLLGVVDDLFDGVDKGGPLSRRAEVWRCPQLESNSP